MNTLGKYQNSIPGLKKLDLENYERIFKVYETLNNDKNFYYYNILKKIQFPEIINSNVIKLYTTPNVLPFTTISHNIYGDIRLWWILFLINKDVLKGSMFTVPAGTQLKYINAQYLEVVFNQITELTILNGKHY
jgi:hypothetical protein